MKNETTGVGLYKDTKGSARVVPSDFKSEPKERAEMMESQGKLMLQMALSSLSYTNFRDLMQDYRAQRNEAAAAAEEMGLF